MGCRQGRGGWKDVASSITPDVSCSACLHPEHAADILVGVGLGCLLQMTSSQLVVKLEPDSLLVWVLAGALGLSLVFSFVWVPAQCFQLGKAYGICLILYYLAFLCVALLTEFRVIRLSAV